jgi:hypothetical protein
MRRQTEPVENRRWLPLAIAGCLLAGLAVAALRVDLIRVRYGLADAVREEKVLLEEHRQALARMRTLRDPLRLARLAASRGLTRPQRIVDLPATANRGLARPERLVDLPATPEQGMRP